MSVKRSRLRLTVMGAALSAHAVSRDGRRRLAVMVIVQDRDTREILQAAYQALSLP